MSLPMPKPDPRHRPAPPVRPVAAAALPTLALATALAGTLLASDPAAAQAGGAGSAVERGAYLVKITNCNDCHTPWKLGPKGPEPDPTRLLSGHPATVVLPPPPKPVGPWVVAGAATNTAFAGPWGISYAANLTADPDTGLGSWDEARFVSAMRTGQHLGMGRPILPPMPWQGMAEMTDADLKAVWAYLKTVKPIKNEVPEAVEAPPPAR